MHLVIQTSGLRPFNIQTLLNFVSISLNEAQLYNSDIKVSGDLVIFTGIFSIHAPAILRDDVLKKVIAIQSDTDKRADNLLLEQEILKTNNIYEKE